jgi:hypothetical protein
MFSQAIQAHKVKTKATKKTLEVERAKTVTAVKAALSTSIYTLDQSVQTVYANQEAIELETKLLQQQLSKFANDTATWLAVYKQLNEGVLELGSVDSWVSALDTDLAFVASVLDNVVTTSRASSEAKKNATAPTMR